MEDFKSVEDQDITATWTKNYYSAPEQLKKMSNVEGLISVFNANIDAVIKVNGELILKLVEKFNLDESKLIKDGKRQIISIEDAVRGIIHCFKSGIAEEWLVDDENVYNWLKDHIGYDKLQMGGQGGIVANVMAVCNVDPVYVHCASLPKLQAGLFLDLNNLYTTDKNGEIRKANEIDRAKDLPLIHWIIEFDKGDTITLAGETFICPKSNRFIATFDPLNFKLHIDKDFASAMAQKERKPEVIILSGYQMLQENLKDGSKGSSKIDQSIDIIDTWRSNNESQIVHLEMASTQDAEMRKHLLNTLANKVDSLGFNERELIDLLEVMGEHDLVDRCNKETNGVNLFEGMLKLFSYSKAPRLQLHMFGLYLTIQKKGFKISPDQNRKGMQLAAVIAAAKAGTGAIDTNDVLLWAKDKEVSDHGLKELSNLASHINSKFGETQLISTGIWGNENFDLIAIPTILIEKPVTLVGMGDTISSISLVAAR